MEIQRDRDIEIKRSKENEIEGITKEIDRSIDRYIDRCLNRDREVER